jgi:hypothetical protein
MANRGLAIEHQKFVRSRLGADAWRILELLLVRRASFAKIAAARGYAGEWGRKTADSSSNSSRALSTTAAGSIEGPALKCKLLPSAFPCPRCFGQPLSQPAEALPGRIRVRQLL